MSKISIVVPMYNEQEALDILYRELKSVTETIPEHEFEYLFVNDGSKDATLDEISWRSRMRVCVTSLSPAISARKRRCMQD